MRITKDNSQSSHFLPLESAAVVTRDRQAATLVVADAVGQIYVAEKITANKPVRFTVRGAAGQQTVILLDDEGNIIEERLIRLVARTGITCNAGPYAKLMTTLQQMIMRNQEAEPRIINGRSYRMLVGWSRDHVYTLKASKYFESDVKSGLDYWLESQEPNGMFWDCIHPNEADPAPTWHGEALGKGWFHYDDGMKWIVRRVPVLADTEYCWTEGVWLAWKASGDDAWMATQLPRLERALKYMTTDPLRWSRKFGLVRRSFTADEWDFANPHYCAGDHRCIHPGDPRFLFHGNQSGLYAMYWRMAEMYEHLGNARRAVQLREQGEALRKRANDKLFFGANYGHMIPEAGNDQEVYALVGNERKRMSLSTGYTINRGMPTHKMAVKILQEYQRRGRQKKAESFAEWWTMDPPYAPSQWPSQHTGTAGCPEGEYMNGGICIIIAGEIAKAAFDHGCEKYGSDILERVWKLAERDGGHLHQVYRRLPENPSAPKASFQFVDLRSVVNRGLKDGAHKTVPAWTGEGENDMRNLPVGRQTFGAIQFDVIIPAKNDGRAVLRLAPGAGDAPSSVTVPVANLKGKSVYFLQCTGHSAPAGSVVGRYDVQYEDGTTERIDIRVGREIAHWWGTLENDVRRPQNSLDTNRIRRAWWGPNPQWKNVGIYMFGWNNPHPDKAITAMRLEALKSPGRGGIMLAGISFSDQPVTFEQRIRSYGLPDCWAQAAVYYAIAEGLAGIEDAGTAFHQVKVSPRWASSQATESEVTLHYPASDGYCAYRYKLDRKARRISLDLTGSFKLADVHCLLPAGKAKRVKVDGEEIPFTTSKVEKSTYADFVLTDLPRRPVVIEY